jgi:hypothetical protein
MRAHVRTTALAGLAGLLLGIAVIALAAHLRPDLFLPRTNWSPAFGMER